LFIFKLDKSLFISNYLASRASVIPRLSTSPRDFPASCAQGYPQAMLSRVAPVS